MQDRPHIVMIVPRGEAVRNFLYSDTLRTLSENVRVTLLSIVDDDKILSRFKPFIKQFIPLKSYNESLLVIYLRRIIEESHFRWLWSELAKSHWELSDFRAKTKFARCRRLLLKGICYMLANRPILEALTALENYITWTMRPNNDFIDLFKAIKPDLVFNCSHVHGPAAELPIRIAHKMGIPTAGFIFSWDNLTSCSRILAPYDYYFVWNRGMHNQLLDMYPFIKPDHVFITGTPQFDFHFKPEFQLSREELCRRIGIDPQRPYIFYTTGVARHFPEEHRTVELVIRLLEDINISPKPQLVVRTYVKDTSPQMIALAKRNIKDVVFPPVLWDKKWFTPMHEDLIMYTSLLYHCSLGINAASTVSLELLMYDKPVINLDFDPPGSNLPHCLRWARHINFDHYRPVAESGATMVARSTVDMQNMLIRGLTQPQADSEKRRCFLRNMFGRMLDGNSGRRVAERLIQLSGARA